jgi:SAM-dependent methyltransferase
VSSDDTLYAETAYYRMLFAERTQDFAFYLRATEGLAHEDEVLELGVGDGRVAVELAREGRRVFGVDASAEMLAGLDERLASAPPEARGRVRYQRGDSRTLRLGQTFRRVTCPFNGIAHFHDDDALDAFFRSVRAHLSPGGLFAFDAIIPDPSLLSGGGASVPWLRHPRTGAICRLEESYAYDPRTMVLRITTRLIDRESGEAQELSLAIRQLFPEATPALLERHGFTVVEESSEIGDAIGYVVRPL